MALIGEFEAAVREADPGREPDQFKLCGEVFTVSDRDLTVPMGRFSQVARAGEHAETLRGLAAMVDLIEAVVVPGDRERFLRVASDNGVGPDVLMAIVQAVVERATGRPTRQPSESSDGLSPTGANSKGSPFGAVPPIQLDPRVRALQPIRDAAAVAVGL